MATNMVYAYTQHKTRVWAVGNDVAPGTPVTSVSGEIGVTITGSGDYEVTETLGGVTVTRPAGGIGLEADEATVAVDGTWEFDVTGGSDATPNNTAVYLTAGGAVTLTGTDNTAFGVVDFPPDYTVVGTTLPVKIGVFA